MLTRIALPAIAVLTLAAAPAFATTPAKSAEASKPAATSTTSVKPHAKKMSHKTPVKAAKGS